MYALPFVVLDLMRRENEETDDSESDSQESSDRVSQESSNRVRSRSRSSSVVTTSSESNRRRRMYSDSRSPSILTEYDVDSDSRSSASFSEARSTMQDVEESENASNSNHSGSDNMLNNRSESENENEGEPQIVDLETVQEVIDLSADEVENIQPPNPGSDVVDIPAQSPRSTPRKRKREDDDDDEGRICSVCFEAWTSAGSHRLVSLKCGHLFGRSCVERWLSGFSKSCPTCKQRARKSDIRGLYGAKVLMLDTTELNDARLKIKCLERQTLELKNELEQVKLILAETKSADPCGPARRGPPSSLAINPKSLYILRLDDGECRVLACNDLGRLAISQEKNNPLWPGYAIRLAKDGDLQQTISMHRREIRDMAFHPCNSDLIMSVSIDQEIKVFNILQNKVVFSHKLDESLWCSTWDLSDVSYAFVGTVRGKVFRVNTVGSEPLAQLPLPPAIKPTQVIALSSSCCLNRLLCARLFSITAYATNAHGQYTCQILLNDTKFSSFVFHEDSGNASFVVCTSKNSVTSYTYYKFETQDISSLLKFEKIRVVMNSQTPSVPILSRPCLFSIKSLGLLFVVYDEPSSTVFGYLIGEASEKRVLTLKMNSHVRDITYGVTEDSKIQMFLLCTNILKCYQLN